MVVFLVLLVVELYSSCGGVSHVLKPRGTKQTDDDLDVDDYELVKAQRES